LFDNGIFLHYLHLFWFYFPLTLIGIYRWSSWIFRRICANYYRPYNPSSYQNHVPTFGIVTPVYNEDPLLFKNALESWYGNKPDEIIAVIDERDQDCIQIFKEFASDKNNLKLLVTSQPGKRPALVKGIKTSKTELLALVDSDVIWELNIKDNLCAPFRNEQIGGVAARQNAIENKYLWQKIADMLWDQRNFVDWASQSVMGQSITCLSGRTAVYRRKIILPLLDEFVNETVFGRRKESGEDKCLTRLIQREGWYTYYQSNAQIYTEAVRNFKTFWLQKVRWTRNTYNSDLVSLYEGWIWKRPFLAFATLDKFISIFTIFIGPASLGIALYHHHYIIALSIILLWLTGRTIKLLPHFKQKPNDIPYIPLYVLSSMWIALAKLYALVTIRDQKWIRPKNRKEVRKKMVKKIKNYLLTSEILTLIVFVLIIL
jgi:cellulose synthase/poly-beta-1,6-N-acetylglucosamine synthase-like glycosyltransferase